MTIRDNIFDGVPGGFSNKAISALRYATGSKVLMSQRCFDVLDCVMESRKPFLSLIEPRSFCKVETLVGCVGSFGGVPTRGIVFTRQGDLKQQNIEEEVFIMREGVMHVTNTITGDDSVLQTLHCAIEDPLVFLGLKCWSVPLDINDRRQKLCEFVKRFLEVAFQQWPDVLL